MNEPTPAELKTEIETGPLASDLAHYWADVFEPHQKPEMTWRTGILKPDAAFEIRRLLIEQGRAAELGWGDKWRYELVVAAKGKTPEDAAPPPVLPPRTPTSPPWREEPLISLPPDMPENVVRFHRVRFELLSQSDRGAAILGGAYVDSMLGEAIKTRLVDLEWKKGQTLFKKLLGNDGPLGRFSAKIDMAFALQLIGEHTYRDLHIVRGIRNEFAHDLEVGSPDKSLTFRTQSVAARCNNLWLPKNEYYAKHTAFMWEQANLDHPRGQYIFAVFHICYLVSAAAMEWKCACVPTVLT